MKNYKKQIIGMGTVSYPIRNGNWFVNYPTIYQEGPHIKNQTIEVPSWKVENLSHIELQHFLHKELNKDLEISI